MNENISELSDIIMLEDDNGSELEVQFLGEIDFENKSYIVCLPNYEDEDQDEVLILRIDGDEDQGEYYASVDDERVISEVFDIFMAENTDLYELEGEE